MRSTAQLKGFTREAAAILARESDLASFEIYTASSESRIARLNYTSDIPSRGLEEFKSLHADGFQDVVQTIDHSELFVRALRTPEQFAPFILPLPGRPYWFERYD